MEQVVLFGMGATKAGTSWLHRYLDTHPDTYFRAVKELHYWSFGGPMGRAAFVERLEERRDGLLERGQQAADRRNRVALERIARNLTDVEDLIVLQADPSNEAYHTFLTEGGEDARLVGDVTPAYALCDAETLAAMQDLAPQTRFIYLMREPVSRLWSHVRMNAERSGTDDMAETANRIFEEWEAGDWTDITARGDYAGAIARLSQVIQPDRLMILFYEDLFSQQVVDRICAFLDLAPHPADFEKKILASAPLPMSDTQRRRARARLQPQYDAALAHLGQLPAKWAA
ncbi:MAG: sulfotransferase [Pseudomonadota bacterium]